MEIQSISNSKKEGKAKTSKRRARVSYKGRNYEKTVKTRDAERRWKSQMLAELDRCPDGIYFKRGHWHSAVETPDGVAAGKFRKLDEAIKWKSRLESQVEFGTYVSEEEGAQTFAEFVLIWQSTKFRASDRTMLRYKGLLKNQILPFFGSKRLKSLAKKDVDAWIAELVASGATPPTIEKAHSLLKQIFKKAVDLHKLPGNPAVGIELPKSQQRPKRALTIDELKALASLSGEHETLVLLLGLMGLRISEALALQIQDVDLKSKELTVSGAFTFGEDYVRVKSSTKTGEIRQIPIPDVLVDRLKVLVGARELSDYLFVTSKGQPINDGWFRKSVFTPATRKLGLKNVTLHSLRHTCASLLISEGAPVTVVARILGHASIVMTLNTYGHFYKDDLRTSMDQLNHTFAA